MNTDALNANATDTGAVRHAYSAMAERYIHGFDSLDALDPDDLALIERRLTACGGVVADLGCGPGPLTAHLRSLGADTIGFDLVPAFIDHARVHHPDGRYALGSILDLPVADASVSGAVSWYSLIHTPPTQLDAALRELRRILVPRAPLVVGFFEAEQPGAFDHKVTTAWRWPVDELSARLDHAGFSIDECIRHPGTTTEPAVRPHATLAATARPS